MQMHNARFPWYDGTIKKVRPDKPECFFTLAISMPFFRRFSMNHRILRKLYAPP